MKDLHRAVSKNIKVIIKDDFFKFFILFKDRQKNRLKTQISEQMTKHFNVMTRLISFIDLITVIDLGQ